jgi:hypothetical protein
MSNTSTLGNPCPYCGLYHTYSPECCRDIQKVTYTTTPPPMMIPDYTLVLGKILVILENIELMLRMKK